MKENCENVKTEEEISKRLLNEDENEKQSLWKCPECGNCNMRSLWPINGGYLYCGTCGTVSYT